MTRLLLDSGAVDRLANEDQHSAALIAELKRAGFWPPVVHTVVLAECLSGRSEDARVYRLLKTCRVLEPVPQPVAARAGALREKAGRGSAVDGLLVAMAEGGDVVLTEDNDDIRALASHARNVKVRSSKPRRLRGRRR